MIPDDADPGQFNLSDGNIEKKPEPPTVRTLGDLFRVYKEELPHGAKEESTLGGERIHMKHLLRHVGARKLVRSLKPRDLQGYINRRSKDTWNDKPIRGDTIAKEITTFRLVWRWAVK